MVLPVLTQPRCFYSYTFCLPPSFSLLCVLLLHGSLSLTLSFSLSRILSCILSRFLAHVFIGTWCSPSHVVLLLFSHSILWFHSLHFYILWFGRFRLGRFPFTHFALTVYKRYVFLSLYAWNVFWMFVS